MDTPMSCDGPRPYLTKAGSKVLSDRLSELRRQLDEAVRPGTRARLVIRIDECEKLQVKFLGSSAAKAQ